MLLGVEDMCLVSISLSGRCCWEFEDYVPSGHFSEW